MPRPLSKDRPVGLLQQYLPMLWSLHRWIDAGLVILVLWGVSAFHPAPWTPPYMTLAVLIGLMAPSIFQAAGLYDVDPFRVRSARLLGGWLLLSLALLAVGCLTQSTALFSLSLLLRWWIAAPVVLWLTRLGLQRLLYYLRRSGGQGRTAIIAGTDALGLQLAQQLQRNPELGIQFQGYFTDTPVTKGERLPCRPLIGTLEELPDFVRRHHIDVVYLALSMQAEERVAMLIDALQDTTASVYFVPNLQLFQLMQARLHSMNGIPLVAVWEVPFSGIQGLAKRLLDIGVATVALILLAPIMAGIAIAIKLTSPGPVLFTQYRYGISGRKIVVYKFRSMTVTENGDTVQQAQRNDPRVTPLGAILRRTSLDELPQFINVLQGRMSIVGPRPHAVSHNEYYRKRVQGYMLRHLIKPGITGWAQVNGFRGETETLDKMQQRIDYDLHYLNHWSLLLDLKIILKTVLVLRGQKNAY